MNSPSEVLPQPEVKQSRLHKWMSRRAAGFTLAGVVVIGGAGGEIVHLQDVTSQQGQEMATLHTANKQLQKQTTRQAQIFSILNNGIDPGVISGKKLVNPEALPGYGQQVGAKDEQLLTGSAVKVMARSKDSHSAWYEICSGNKITLDYTAYVSLAAHCFGDVRAKLNLNVQPGPYNVLPDSSNEYAIMDSHAQPSPQGDDKVLARVTGISIEPGGVDWALASVSDAGSSIAQGKWTGPLFDTMPALDFGGADPTPGQAAITYGMPASNNERPVLGHGVYLGEVRSPDDGQMVDLIGLMGVRHPNQDSCSYGSSGSAAIIGNGHETGPLSLRDNVTFFPGTADANYKDDPATVGEPSRLKLEAAAHVDMSSYATVCSYTAGEVAVPNILATGFDRIAPLAPTGGMK